MVTRRKFIQLGAMAGAGVLLPWPTKLLRATPLVSGLSDPALQPKFVNMVPNALHPSFKFKQMRGRNNYRVGMYEIDHATGLVDPAGKPLTTRVWGYGYDNARGATWPGRTFEVKSGPDTTTVNWFNNLPKAHLLPVDSSLHWCYSLPGYDNYSIANDGVPVIPHLHGGHTDYQFDGNPEYFLTPGGAITGPQWNNVQGGFTNSFVYDNNVPAGTLWYHDHALGITRLNVYAGLAGFYIVRDQFDTGKPDNPLGLPAFPYELAYAIQDRMFLTNGALFYPAFPGDPAYDEFIEEDQLPINFGPTALAEFFGDHIVVNGKIWPKADVEPRHYRIRLLNGCDSRFMALRFRAVPAGQTDLTGAGEPIPFHVIGSDQGLASSATFTDTLVFEPGSRYDVVFDFSDPALAGMRVIMENTGGDVPFGGDLLPDLEPGDLFPNRQTDRVMAFDVVLPLDTTIPDTFAPAAINHYAGNTNGVNRTRKVALFEGTDEFGRLQPLLGTAEPATDWNGEPINWPAEFASEGLTGQMNGAASWHAPTTENPKLGDTEIWEIYNATGDAHPIHLHLINFQVLDRKEFSATVVSQPLVQHNGEVGQGYRLEDIEDGDPVSPPDGYAENAPKDMVIALPGQVTRIKATFDKPGRYVWHCHILSHEDHEMMRVLEVTDPNANKQLAQNDQQSGASLGASPNPFNPETTLHYTIPQPENVRIDVYDIKGRRVKTLVNSQKAAGSYTIRWNGRNEQGRHVSSGMYFARLEAGKLVAKQKLIFAK